MNNSELPLGKISPDIFKEIIYPALGAEAKEILIGPQNGVDIAITKVGNKVMATTTDPVFIVKEYGFEKGAWFAIHILVSDVVMSGLKPKYLTIDLNLPVEINKKELSIIWNTIHRECEKMGIAIISGHTARYLGCNYPMVGGATVIAIGNEDEYIAPIMAKPGDKIIITKGAAIEATGLFAATWPQRIKEIFGESIFNKADALFYEMSVIKDAEIARNFGLRENGVTTMHDATEGGVLGGLYEVAKASNVGMIINKKEIIVREEVKAICDHMGIDPYISISEGTLILSVKSHKADALIKEYEKNNITASIIGEITEEQKITIKDGNHEEILEHPNADPFWAAFARFGDGG
ncbi:AIR synthase family protein [bacterium]|nr:AIR synthase family protein [bacterium]